MSFHVFVCLFFSVDINIAFFNKICQLLFLLNSLVSKKCESLSPTKAEHSLILSYKKQNKCWLVRYTYQLISNPMTVSISCITALLLQSGTNNHLSFLSIQVISSKQRGRKRACRFQMQTSTDLS